MIKQLTSKDVEKGSGLTTAQLRKDVSQLLKMANKVKFESGDDAVTSGAFDYFLTDFHENKRGGISANFDWTHVGKTQLRSMYNQLVRYINTDTQSAEYDDARERSLDTFVKWINERQERLSEETGIEYEKVTREDAQQMMDLKDAMPELFDSQSFFYEDVVVSFAEYRKSNGNKSVLQMAYEVKKKKIARAKKSGKSYTDAELKKAITQQLTHIRS